MRHHAILAASAALGLVPRAICSPVRAEKTAEQLIAEIAGNVENRLKPLEAAFNEQAVEMASLRLNGAAGSGGGGVVVAPDPEYSRTFASFIRTGASEEQVRSANATGQRGQIQASMSTASNPDGGFLTPTEWDRKIQQAQVTQSPMRQIAQVRTTSVGAYSTLWNNNQWGSGWVGEVAARPATTNAQLSSLIFPSGEIYAMPSITQRLLDDAQLDIASWLSDQVSTEFNRQEGIAFVSGDGVNKPAGYLAYVTGGAKDGAHPAGNLDVIYTGQAATLGANAAGIIDTLTDFAYGLAAPYRQNATWVMNSMSAALLAKLKDANGNLIWRESLIVGQPATLMGRPVAIDENLLGVAAGNLAIAFGDFRAGYVINDRMGVRVVRDPYTAKPFVQLYTTKRVGGGVLDPRAIRLLKVGVAPAN